MTAALPVYAALADLYDWLNPSRTADKAFYRGLVRGRSSRVLDVACGTGTVTAELAATSSSVTGLDASLEMLALASARLPDVRLIEGDMTAFELDAEFDLVTCSFNSLQHLDSDEQIVAALSTMARHLAPDGRLAFDVFNPARQFLRERRDVEMLQLLPPHADLVLREDTIYCESRALLTITWKVVSTATGNEVRRATYTMRQIFPDDVLRLVDVAGLRVVERFGDFNRSRFTPASPRQVIVAGRIA